MDCRSHDPPDLASLAPACAMDAAARRFIDQHLPGIFAAVLFLTPTAKALIMAQTDPDAPFGRPGSKTEVEQGRQLTPRFDRDGLVPCVVTDRGHGGVLMLAYMNAEALVRTIDTGEAHYWSRSRRQLWRKGETSGHVQKVVELRIDCDQDAVWLQVEQHGAACHTGYRTCFFRAVPLGGTGSAADKELVLSETGKAFDPRVVYGSQSEIEDG